MSTQTFSSSSDSERYLRSHSDYQCWPPSNFDAIVAAVVSALAVVGSVIIVVVTSGGAGPLLVSSLLACSGATGFQNAISGSIHCTFSWTDFGQAVGLSAGLTLITFGAGYGVGNLVGIALRGTNLTAKAIQAIGSVTGGIVGSGMRSGSYSILRKVGGRVVDAIELTLEAVQGFIAGAIAGYAGASATMSTVAQNAADTLSSDAFQGAVCTAWFEQTVIEAFQHPTLDALD